MSEEVVKDAERIVWWWETMYIASTGSSDYNKTRDHFLGAIDTFRRSKTLQDKAKVAEAALEVLSKYDDCIVGKHLSDTDKALNGYTYQKERADRLDKKIDDLNEAHQGEMDEFQKKYDELLEQFGVMKGRYEECGKRLDQIIQAAGLSP